MFGVTANTILWANDLNRGSVIHAGDTLVILPVTGIEHVVQRGETLASIAKKYKGDLAEIIAFNSLPSGASVAVGDTIVIPDGVEPSVPASSGSITSPLHGAGGPLLAGYYLPPTPDGVKTQGLHGYNGVDLASFCGAPILASAGGQVIVAKKGGWNGGYGQYVVIQHSNDTQTLYAHESSVIVSPGQSVVQGQVIGYMGKTGKATGCHVHFEVRGAANPF
jgi:murein DD-endopeptidase MepM/ murein hydrolase activator NlpD